MAGHCVSMVEVRMLSDVESNLASRVQADTKVTLRADSLDSAEFSVSDLQFLRWCRELDAVARGEFMLHLAMDRHSGEPSRIVGLQCSLLALDRYTVFLRVHMTDSRVLSCFDLQAFASTRVANHVPRLILPSPLAICSRHFLTRLQNSKFVLVFAHVSAILHFAMDQRIQFASGFIVGRDDQCPLRFSCILSGNCVEA